MKRLGQYLILFGWMIWTLASLAFADRLVTVAWEPPADLSADGYHVWDSTGPEPILLAAVEKTSAEIVIPDGETKVTVTSVSLTGESGHSQALSLPPVEPPPPPPPVEPPTPPTPKIPVNVELRLKKSKMPFDYVGAKTIAVHFLTEADPESFYHLEIITTPAP